MAAQIDDFRLKSEIEATKGFVVVTSNSKYRDHYTVMVPFVSEDDMERIINHFGHRNDYGRIRVYYDPNQRPNVGGRVGIYNTFNDFRGCLCGGLSEEEMTERTVAYMAEKRSESLSKARHTQETDEFTQAAWRRHGVGR